MNQPDTEKFGCVLQARFWECNPVGPQFFLRRFHGYFMAISTLWTTRIAAEALLAEAMKSLKKSWAPLCPGPQRSALWKGLQPTWRNHWETDDHPTSGVLFFFGHERLDGSGWLEKMLDTRSCWESGPGLIIWAVDSRVCQPGFLPLCQPCGQVNRVSAAKIQAYHYHGLLTTIHHSPISGYIGLVEPLVFGWVSFQKKLSADYIQLVVHSANQCTHRW